jgi:hypothetical protein
VVELGFDEIGLDALTRHDQVIADQNSPLRTRVREPPANPEDAHGVVQITSQLASK